MKLYIHYEDAKAAPSFTKQLQVQYDESVSGLLSIFSDHYNKEYGPDIILDPKHLGLKDAAGKVVTRLSKCEDRDDLFVFHIGSASSPPIISSNKVPPPKVVSVKAVSAKDASTLRQNVLQLLSKRLYRKAQLLCQQALKTDFPNDAILLNALVGINLSLERYDVAAEHAEALTTATPGDAAAYLSLGRALFGCKRFEDAEAALVTARSAALKASKLSAKSLLLDIEATRAECIFELGRHGEAADIVNSSLSTTEGEQHVPSLLAYSEFAIRYQKVEEPIQALLRAVTLEQSNERLRKMLVKMMESESGFCEMMQQLPVGPKAAAAYAFLSTIARDYSAFRPCIALIKASLQIRPGYPIYLLNLIHVYENTFELPLVISSIIEFCDINSSMRIGTHGYSCAELSETLRAITRGPAAVASAVATGPAGTRTSTSGSASTSANADPIGEALNSEAPTLYLRWREIEGMSDSGFSESLAIDETPGGAESGVESATAVDIPSNEKYSEESLELLAVGFTAVKVLYGQGYLGGLPKLIALIEPTRRRTAELLHQTSIRNEHAYYQCIMHVLSHRPTTIGDAAAAAAAQAEAQALTVPVSNAALIDADPTVISTREAVGSPAASTTVALTAARIFAFSDPLTSPLLAAAAASPIYVCGDSHCLAAAWSVLMISGRPRLLVPRVVTGVKHWHLRPDSSFYPKANFFNAVRNIPDGADVIFIIGEIDCREGLLVALERDKYSSLEQGMESTIGIFATVLNQLIRSRNFKVWVHPVLPMLAETRCNVLAYNPIYKRIVETKVKGAKWLEFADDLLQPAVGAVGALGAGAVGAEAAAVAGGGLELRPEFKLDGTHIHPVYTKLLERALQAHSH